MFPLLGLCCKSSYICWLSTLHFQESFSVIWDAVSRAWVLSFVYWIKHNSQVVHFFLQSIVWKRNIGRYSPHGQHRNQTDYIVCRQRWRSSIQSAKTRPGADCGSDHEVFIAKFRFKLKKVGKITRLFKYDLNEIPYDYTVEVRNRFKGLDLIDKSAWWPMEWGSWHCTGDRDQDHPHGKEMQKSKTAAWGGLTNSCEKKRSEKQRRKGKI